LSAVQPPSPEQFRQCLLAWFDRCGRRDLPWQSDTTAYRVWVSEIMLQQTRVKTVIPYFRRFMRRFPTVESLAEASIDEVLHLWTGLGYYARARNLHRCARIVAARYGGEFPQDVDSLAGLPGIGRSTAGAIRSLAHERPATVLDGNVKRVLARYAAVAGWPGNTAVHKALWELAESLTPVERSADYTQAMMDLGATVCTRSKPACDICPLARWCRARAAGTQTAYPGRKPGREMPVKSTTMLIVSNPRGEVFLERRPPAGIWGGLWSFPEVAGRDAARDFCIDRFGHPPLTQESWQPLRHTFSHYHLDIRPLRVELPANGDCIMEGDGRLWYNFARPETVGMAAPVSRLLHLLNRQGYP